MSNQDEPILGGPDPDEHVAEAGDLGRRIHALVNSEPFAVLATQGEEQPYGSVVATAFTPDLSHVVFGTPITTRKYRFLIANDRIAMVVDDRPRWRNELMRVQAVTLTGRAHPLERNDDFAPWADLLVARHPQLEGFVSSPSCALFRVDIVRFFHVQRFQEVREWSPPLS